MKNNVPNHSLPCGLHYIIGTNDSLYRKLVTNKSAGGKYKFWTSRTSLETLQNLTTVKAKLPDPASHLSVISSNVYEWYMSQCEEFK